MWSFGYYDFYLKVWSCFLGWFVFGRGTWLAQWSWKQDKMSGSASLEWGTFYFWVKIDNTPEITPFATLTNLMMKNRYRPNKKVPQGHDFSKFFQESCGQSSLKPFTQFNSLLDRFVCCCRVLVKCKGALANDWGAQGETLNITVIIGFKSKPHRDTTSPHRMTVI